ncbi:MAG: ATP-dependent Clp protease proteolytic subunit [Ignavibacterium sp.]|nr:ATP-dependent Clp protease proteolytic subunit [Ignavibacterium sp.]
MDITKKDQIKERKLFLFEIVDNKSVENIIKEIILINAYDDEQEKNIVNYERQPIELYINSVGGSAYDGFGLISVMQTSKTPIHTIVIGYAMSMAFGICVAGHKRYAHKYSRFMYHQVRGYIYGSLKDIEIDVDEYKTYQEHYDNLILENTFIQKEKLEDVKNRNIDWYISAQDALKLKIIDEIID